MSLVGGEAAQDCVDGGFTLAAAQIGQFMKFDEMSKTSTSHGCHTSVGSVLVEVPLSGLRLIMMA